MINVIVAVAGLTLVQVPHGRPIDIYLPETEGFWNPRPYFEPVSKRLGPLAMDNHDVAIEMKNLGSGDPSVVVEDPPRFRLKLTLDGGGAPAVVDRSLFPQLKRLVPEGRSAKALGSCWPEKLLSPCGGPTHLTVAARIWTACSSTTKPIRESILRRRGASTPTRSSSSAKWTILTSSR